MTRFFTENGTRRAPGEGAQAVKLDPRHEEAKKP
jgi:hypothetical protein